MADPFDLSVNEWWQVPDTGNSQLADVYASPAPDYNQAAIMSAWGGACVDTSRKDLIVWGGGHNDYYGNEVYAFSFDPASGNYLTWRRKAYYSTPGNDVEENSDGSAAIRHTYSTIHYDPSLDQMIVMPGGFLAGTGGNISSSTWGFDCSNETPDDAAPDAWTRYDDNDSNARPNACRRDSVAKYYMMDNFGFDEFDPSQSATNQWTQITTFESSSVDFNACTSIPGSPDRMVWPETADGGELFVRELDDDTWDWIGSPTTGAGVSGDINIFDANIGAGVAYDDNDGSLLVWHGTVTGGTDNRDMYYLDPSDYSVVRVSGTGDVPDDPAGNGTFGRFANLNGCGAAYVGLNILVNSTTSDVYFYRSSSAPSTLAKGPLGHPLHGPFGGPI